MVREMGKGREGEGGRGNCEGDKEKVRYGLWVMGYGWVRVRDEMGDGRMGPSM